MSKGQMFRALVNERLAAAAKDIFTLYKRMIAENEEELGQSEEENQRKQQLLNQALSPRVLLNRVGPGLSQAMTQTPRIKEEPEEQDATQEQEQLSVPESSAHLHYEGLTENCVDTDSYEDWTRPLSWSDADMETESDGDENNQVQIRGRSTKRSARNRPAPETSATVHAPGPDGGERKKLQRSVRRKRCNLQTHTGEKSLSCSFCDKSFASQGRRDIHIRIHTGEKPYSCSVCDKAFAQKNNWDRHIRTHTGEKPYSCSVCDKAFAQKNNRDTHIRTHTGEKPFSCPVCDTSFARKMTLDVHSRLHTGEKPYSCTVCDKTFAQPSALRQHKKKPHRRETVAVQFVRKTFKR